MKIIAGKIKSIRVIIIVLLLLVITAFIPGCWDRREIDKLAFVSAIGIDKTADGKICLTAVIHKPFVIQTSEGGATTQERAFWLTSSTGQTAFEAMRNFERHSPRFLFFAHNRFLVMGEEYAAQGVREALDYFDRDRQIRRTTRLVVVQGMTAAEFLQSEFELELSPPTGAMVLMENAANRLATTVDTNLNDFLIMLKEEGAEAVAGRVDVIAKNPGSMEGELLRDEIIQSPLLSGAAVFKDDRLIGWLGEAETKGLQWVRGQVVNATLVIENPQEKRKLIGLEVIHASSEVIPSVSSGTPAIKVVIQLTGKIKDTHGKFQPDHRIIQEIEQRMAAEVKKEIKAALHRSSQELQADIFGFGSAIHRKFPRDWDLLQDSWDEKFARLNVAVDVQAKVSIAGAVIRGH